MREVSVQGYSTAWETPAVGSVGPDFINMVARLSTPLSAEALKTQVLNKIERQLGRIRTADKNAPRTIDLDILIYAGRAIDPQIWVYPHLAIPLAELIPEFRNAQTNVTLAEVARRLLQESDARLLPRPDISVNHSVR